MPDISRIGQIAVTVTDVERARDFYRDVVGLQHLFDVPGMSFFDCGGTRLLLGKAERGAAHGTSILYFDTAAINAVHAAMAERGARFEQAPHRVADLGDRELWLAFFRDTEGNTMGLMSEVPKTGG